MPYPYLISAGVESMYQGDGFRTDVFAYGSYIFTVLADGTNNHVEVWGSNDEGVTWSEQDSANHKSTATSDEWSFTRRLGNTLHISYISPAAADLRVATFDLVTRAWGAEVTGGPVPADRTGVNSPWDTERDWSMEVLNDGSYVVVTQTTKIVLAVTYFQINVWTYSSGAGWIDRGAAFEPDVTEVDQVSYIVNGTALGDSGRVHIFALTSQSARYHRAYRSGSFYAVSRNYDHAPELFDNNPTGPFMATLAGVRYVCRPTGFSFFEGPDPRTVPGMIILRDMDEPTEWRTDYVLDESVYVAIGKGQNVSGIFDGVDTVYLVYTKYTVGPTLEKIKRACTKGAGWSTPVDVFDPAAGGGPLIESVFASLVNGKLGVILQNTTGTAPYEWPHYHQSDLACAAPSSGGDEGKAYWGSA